MWGAGLSALEPYTPLKGKRGGDPCSSRWKQSAWGDRLSINITIFMIIFIVIYDILDFHCIIIYRYNVHYQHKSSVKLRNHCLWRLLTLRW